MNSFTYTISSIDNLLGGNQASNVQIYVSGLPTQYKYFKCRVLNFIVNYGSFTNAWRPVSYIMLLCDNVVGIQNITTGNRVSQVIATANLIDGTMKNENGNFVIKNLNDQKLLFTLVDEAFNNIDALINQNTVVTAWTLTLELTPIEEKPNNYDLRNGL